MAVFDGALCSNCATVDFARFFREEVHRIWHSDAFTSPDPKHSKLCSLADLCATRKTCAACAIIAEAMCKRTRHSEFAELDDYLSLLPKDGLSAINVHLYSYAYADDSSTENGAVGASERHKGATAADQAFRLAVALKAHDGTDVQDGTYLDHEGDIQLIWSSSGCITTTGPLFYGRRVDSVRANIGLARTWLDECAHDHGALCEIAAVGDLAYQRKAPRNLRVIDVHSMALTVLPAQAKFVALSYCWGQSRIHFTTRLSNAKELHESDSLRKKHEQLPGTIRDAIDCTRELGLHYLWVDALCIVQDDDNDKKAQISQMDRIYDSAFVTIISAPEKNSKYDGLPGYRTGSRTRCHNIARVQGLELTAAYSSIEAETSVSTWSKRAWTFQEYMLSRRRLYFTETQLYFQCSWGICCEDAVGEGKRSSAAFNGLSSLYGPTSNIPHSSPELRDLGFSRSLYSNEESAYDFYMSMVEMYSGRDMTHQSDALIALEGLLSILRASMDTEFICGLPEKFLNHALLFFQRTPHIRRTGFPSWSWLGWNSYCNYIGHIDGYIFSDIDWYLSSADGVVCKISPDPAIAYAPDPWCSVRPKPDAPAGFLHSLQPRTAISSAETMTCSLICWTSTAQFRISGEARETARNSLDWKNQGLFTIADDELRTVGTIFLDCSWLDEQPRRAFEFILLSRSLDIRDEYMAKDTFYPISDFCFLNVMLIERDGDRARRAALGTVHETAWIAAGPVPKLVRLE